MPSSRPTNRKEETIAKSLAEFVEGAAEARNQPPVPRKCIDEALRRIDAEQEEVTRYPNGKPFLKDVYDVAVHLESAASTKN